MGLMQKTGEKMERISSKEELNSIRDQFVAKGFASAFDCHVDRAIGAKIYDSRGREYIDFSGGIAVMNVGHSHPEVIKAITEQVQKFTHTCFMVLPYALAIELAEKLCRAVPGNYPKSAMFCNSGAEAVENAVKIARYYTKKQAIIVFENGFHGRTLLGMSLTSKYKPYKLGFGPFAPEVYRMPFAYCYRCPFHLKHPECNTACADYLETFLLSHIAPENTAAIIVEPIQGEGGFIAPPREYFVKLRKICDANNILFIADEIQTGIGRTGTMFAMEHFGVTADLVTSAKSLAAGMPLGAVVGKKEIMDSVHTSGIGGTYGGNPLACAAALAVLKIFESENLLEKSQALGERLQTHLRALQDQYECIGDVRGIGPMMAIELVDSRKNLLPAADKAKSLIRYCFENGLILLSCGLYGNVIRFLMPLIISEQELEKGISIIDQGLKKITEQ